MPLLLNCICMHHVPRGGKLCGRPVVALCGGRVAQSGIAESIIGGKMANVPEDEK